MLTERLKKLEAGESAALAVEQRKYHDLKKQVSELKESQRKHVSHETSLVCAFVVFAVSFLGIIGLSLLVL